MIVMVGAKRHPFPRPIHKPWERNTCQYLVALAAVNIPSICSAEPVRKICRKYPASVARPVKVPVKKSRNTWMEPIHDISEGGCSRAVA